MLSILRKIFKAPPADLHKSDVKLKVDKDLTIDWGVVGLTIRTRQKLLNSPEKLEETIVLPKVLQSIFVKETALQEHPEAFLCPSCTIPLIKMEVIHEINAIHIRGECKVCGKVRQAV